MKLQNKSLLFVAGLAVSTALTAGSSSGSGPPAKEALEQLMRETPSIDGGLFLESNLVKLGLSSDPATKYTVTRTRIKPQDLILTKSEINLLETQVAEAPAIPLDIEAETLGSKAQIGGNKSYRVTLGAEPGSVELRERRSLIREGILERRPELKQAEISN